MNETHFFKFIYRITYNKYITKLRNKKKRLNSVLCKINLKETLQLKAHCKIGKLQGKMVCIFLFFVFYMIQIILLIKKLKI